MLQSRAAPELCYVVSENAGLDGRTLRLKDALGLIVGMSIGTLVSCIPGRRRYFEGEDRGERFVLEREGVGPQLRDTGMEPQYIGPPDLHDGRVLSASEPVHGNMQVRVVGASGSRYVLSFSGVSLLQSNNPIGMLLYGLAEFAVGEAKRFVFVNWDETDTAALEVVALEMRVVADAKLKQWWQFWR